MTYRIADYLNEEALTAILAHKYEPTFRDGLGVPLPRTTVQHERCCPLGIGLRAMLKRDTEGSPSADDVVLYLTGHEGIEDHRDGLIYDAAWDFIDAWDHGHITDLAAALGVGGEE